MNLRALVLALLLPAVAAAAEQPVSTTIEAVTVHPSSALVARKGRAQVPAGSVRLLLEGLTPQLADDSLRLGAGGSARARLLGVAVEMQPQPDSTSPEVRAAEEAVRDLEFRDRAVADRLEAAEKQKSFLDALRATYAKERSENLATRRADPREWSAMVAFLGREYEAVFQAVRDANRERADLQRELDAARRRLAQIQGKGARSYKRAVVDLQVDRAGTLDLELTYLVYGASWQPVWDARLDPGAERVELGLQAQVQQTTGEDWANVALTVSSAEPQRRTVVPELEPLYLTKYAPPPPRPYDARPQVAQKASRAAADEAEAGAPGVFAPAPAEVRVNLLATSYVAPSRATIPSTGERRKSFLAAYPLQAQLRRVSAPVLEQRAYLTAKAKNDTDVPLLAGPIELYVEGDFVGRSRLDGVSPGDELELAFGPDERIRVERAVIDRDRDESGVFSKRERYTYRVRTKLKNLYREAVEVNLLDHLPVSRDEDIEVEVLDRTTAGAKEDEQKPGVRTWLVRLKPGEERVIEVSYAVSYPRGARVVNLP